MEEWENTHNIKYDNVIKARTDFIFKPEFCYKDTKDYLNDKKEKYINDLNEYKVIRASNAIPQKFNKEENHWYGGKPFNVFDPSTSVYNRDLYNIIRSGDVSIAASRKAADYYYNRWFDNFIQIYLDDLKHGNDNPELQLHRRHDGIQGEIAIRNNIKIIRAKTWRDHRVVMKNNHKVKWVRNKEKSIILESLENGEEIINKHFKRYYNVI